MTTLNTKVLEYISRAGSITAQDAFLDLHGMAANTLSKTITRLIRAGHPLHKEQRKHPVTGTKYTRYFLGNPV